MTSTYAIIEGRIQKAIEAINTRENPNRAEIAREFRVPYERLRSRLRGYQSKTAVRGLHNRALKPDQESALRQYLTKLKELGLPARRAIDGKRPSCSRLSSLEFSTSTERQMGQKMVRSSARSLQS